MLERMRLGLYPVGDLLVDVARHLKQARACGQGCQHRRGIAGLLLEHRRAVEHGVDGESGLETMLQLTTALDDKQSRLAPLSRFLLKGQQTLDLGILRTGDKTV